MTEQEQRALVVTEARRWIRTPYHHGADIRGAGVDCLMLLVRVYADLGLIPRIDPRPYQADWMLHNNDELYLDGVLAHAREVESPKPGDIALFRWGRTLSHGGIVTVFEAPGRFRLIHAAARAGFVLEDDATVDVLLSDPKRARRFFSRWNDDGSLVGTAGRADPR
jgi:hypothetical protein